MMAFEHFAFAGQGHDRVVFSHPVEAFSLETRIESGDEERGATGVPFPA